MKKLLTALLLICFCAPLDASRRPRTPDAQYGWSEAKETTFLLDPMELKIGTAMWTKSTVGRIHVEVDAELPVLFGLYPKIWANRDVAARRIYRAEDFNRMKCAQINTLKFDVVCEITIGDTLIMRDKRAEGSALLGAYGAVHGATDMVDKATKPNTIKVKISEWKCIAYCSPFD